MTPTNSEAMAAGRTDLPELITAKQAMCLLGIRHRLTFARVAAAHPRIACQLPGLKRPKYRRREVESILRERSV